MRFKLHIIKGERRESVMKRVEIISAEKVAEKALEERLENLNFLRQAPCVSLKEYGKVLQEVKEISRYLKEKRKKRLFG